jgi:nucleotide-binding universal stress UspA family protein
MKLGERELQDQLKRQTIATIEPLIVETGRTRRTDVRVEFGSPHEVITHVARERHADVVVVGPGRGRTLTDKILGSTADRVIRTSAAPVLVVRKPSTEPYRSVAIAVDVSPQAARAFIDACMLAPDAAFQLVHAIDIPLTFQQAMLRAGTSQIEMERYRAARADKAREELTVFQRDVLGAKELPVCILDGEPGPALVRFSKGPRVDLLALGSHGRGATLQALLGSVARRVLGEAACDVLVSNIQQRRDKRDRLRGADLK